MWRKLLIRSETDEFQGSTLLGVDNSKFMPDKSAIRYTDLWKAMMMMRKVRERERERESFI